MGGKLPALTQVLVDISNFVQVDQGVIIGRRRASAWSSSSAGGRRRPSAV